MRDIFYNYDHNINKKEFTCVMPNEIPPKILESTPNLSLVLDAFGNQIGIAVKQGVEFSLYFILDGYVEGSCIYDLVYSSKINFQLIDYWKNTAISLTFEPDEVYLYGDTLKITVPLSEAQKLKQETYTMNLALTWAGGMYPLYSENNGFLTVEA